MYFLISPLDTATSELLARTSPTTVSYTHLDVYKRQIKATSTNAGLRQETDQRWKDYVDGWIADLRKTDAINTIVLSNLDKLMGIKREEIPAIVSF